MTDPHQSIRPKRRYDLIAFDWDGTLFDSTKHIARSIQQAVKDVGGAVPDESAAAFVIGLPVHAALARVAPDVKPEQYEALGQSYRHHYHALAHELTLFPGVLEMLVQLRESQYCLSIATGKSRSGLNRVLTSSPLKDLFDASRTADETRGKPDPQMLKELMSHFGVSPQRTLMVGDTCHDMEMAQRAGCASLGVTYGAQNAQDLNPFAPLALVHSVSEMVQWFKIHG
jgi:phosphoglycolate phosphatase